MRMRAGVRTDVARRWPKHGRVIILEEEMGGRCGHRTTQHGPLIELRTSSASRIGSMTSSKMRASFLMHGVNLAPIKTRAVGEGPSRTLQRICKREKAKPRVQHLVSSEEVREYLLMCFWNLSYLSRGWTLPR